MGTWGVAIFSDDTAADLRDEYRERLGNGASDPEATEQTLAGYSEWPFENGMLLGYRRSEDRFAIFASSGRLATVVDGTD